jgi:glycosyltransferase involved in cell wall biosynthesis
MNREVADEGRAGLLAAADGEFADQLQRLLADPDLRRRLGQHGRSLAVERYSLEVVAAQVAQHLGVWRKSGEAA